MDQQAMERVDAALDRRYAQASPEARQAFTVDDDLKALWALRRLARLEQTLDENEATVRAGAQLLRDWADDEARLLAPDVAYFTGLLRGYYERLKAAGKLRGKSYRLPLGRLRMVPLPLHWHRDEDALLTWAKAQGLTRTTVVAAWDRIKRHLQPVEARMGASARYTPTGEILDSVRVERLRTEEFRVEIGAAGREDGAEGEADGDV